MPTAAINNLKPADLPAPPQAALEMLRACMGDDVDQKVLAQFAESDPVLTAELLRVVNTPLFGLGKEIASVKHAISLLGIRTLRSIVLCLMVREAVQGHAIPGFNLTEYWEDTLRRATCARLLASHLKLDADEAFTLGMMQDFGTLLLFYLHPQRATEYSNLRRLEPRAAHARENDLFGMTHTQVFSVLAQSWSLPQSLITAIATHHQPDDNMQAKLLNCCDWVNAVFTTTDVNSIFDQTRRLLRDELNLSGQDIQTLFDELPENVAASAQTMRLHIPVQIHFEDLLRQANSQLAKDNTEYQELTWQLEKAITERDRLASELDAEIALAREIQRKLMPDTESDSLPVYGLNIPARYISGDFFDYLQQKNGDIWFALGDVSGKGVNAGMLMAKTASLFRCLAKYMTDPVKLVQMMNNELCETSTRGYFVTMVVGLYKAQQQQVQLVNAGHLPVLILGDDAEPLVLPADDPPLGILPDTQYGISDAICLQSKALYLYSDGVTETMHKHGHILGVDGLVQLINQHNSKPANTRLQAIVDALLPDYPLHDDITLLMFEP